jgi:hypothetical protein
MTQALVHHGAVESPVERLQELYDSASDGTHPTADDTVRRLFGLYVADGSTPAAVPEPPRGAFAAATRTLKRFRRSR